WHPPGRRTSAFVFLVVARARHTQIVVAAQVDVVVGRILVLVDIFQFLVGQIGIGLLGLLLLDLLERDRLLGLEHRFGIPLVPAFDARHRLVLAEIVEAFTALGAATLSAPLRLHHGYVPYLPATRPAWKLRDLMETAPPIIKSRRGPAPSRAARALRQAQVAV